MSAPKTYLYTRPGLCLAIVFLSCTSSALAQLQTTHEPDRLIITNGQQKVVEYVYSHPEILRPHLTRAHSPSGLLLTRANPPVAGVDAVDHASMHPGLWMAWGDINGLDYWRNKARIKHVRFIEEPALRNERLSFATENQFLNTDEVSIGKLINRLTISSRSLGTVILWQATIEAGDEALKFGDQEEMGFGVRMATPLTEKKSGVIINSRGLKSAAKTWGQAADWCDYSGQIDGRACGITVLASPKNMRSSWWHNRDYGLCVANPFAKAAMKQGASDSITIAPHQSLTITFGAILHDTSPYDPAAAYQQALDQH